MPEWESKSLLKSSLFILYFGIPTNIPRKTLHTGMWSKQAHACRRVDTGWDTRACACTHSILCDMVLNGSMLVDFESFFCTFYNATLLSSDLVFYRPNVIIKNNKRSSQLFCHNGILIIHCNKFYSQFAEEEKNWSLLFSQWINWLKMFFLLFLFLKNITLLLFFLKSGLDLSLLHD